MKNWLMSVLTAVTVTCTAADGLIFHFDFKGCQGRTSWRDRTGQFEARVETGNLVEQSDALRTSVGARITIADTRPPRPVPQLTVMAWLLKKSTPDVTPILMRGEHPFDVQFLFSVGWRYPQFAYKNESRQGYWKGLWYAGDFGSSIHYPDRTWLRPGTHLIESSGYWRHAAATFDRGKVKLYLDGRLAAENRVPAAPEVLRPSAFPFVIAAERITGERANHVTADMLLNDLRLYDRVLDPQEIQDIRQSELTKYPQGNLIPRGETHLNALAPCYDYLPSQYDPLMKRTLPVTQKYLQQEKPADPFPQGIEARIRGFQGIPGLELNGKRQPLVMGIPNQKDGKTGKWKFHEAKMGVLNFAAAGIDLISAGIDPDTFWKDEGKYDWAMIERLIKDKIEINPRVALMLYVSLTPPAWFISRYPDELEKSYFGADCRTQHADPLGSDKWIETKCRMLRDLVNHVESQDYGRHVFAYLLGGGQSNEWYWPASVYGGIPGYSKATRQSFRKWLGKHYRGDVQSLRKSWRDAQVTFDSAQVPTPQMRRSSENGLFRDPQQAAAVIDFRCYMTDQTVKNIGMCSRTVKEASQNRKLTLVYSGYALPIASRKLFHSGLCGAWDILQLPTVDMVATPIDYGMRRGGEPGLRVNAFDGSAKLAGKLLWQEDDPRTHLCLTAESGRSADIGETVEIQNRSLAQAVTRGAGCWWLLFDNAWFQQNEIITALKKNVAIARQALSHSQKSVAQAAVVFSEKSHYYLADSGSAFLQFHTWELYQESVKSGAVFDYYYEPDLLNPAMPDYKLYIFIDSYAMDDATRLAIRHKLQRNGATAVWCYAPGYFNGTSGSTQNMTGLTGFNFKQIRDDRVVNVPAMDSKLFGRLPGRSFSANPRFYVTGPAEVKAAGGGVFAVRDMDGWQSVYSLLPLDRHYLRALCRHAGIHVYSDDGDMLMTNHGHLMIHTIHPGNKTIRLPRPFRVTELYSGRVLGKDISCFTEEKLPAGVTRLYRLDRAN